MNNTQQIKIHKNLKAGSTYIYIPNWVSNALGLIKGEKLIVGEDFIKSCGGEEKCPS